MFDPLLEDDPWVQEKVAESERKGEMRGKNQGELNKTREIVVRFIQRRFPALTKAAQTKMQHLDQVEVIDTLMNHLWEAPDENTARALLEAA